MIIDHMGIAISNVEKSKHFYSKVLAPLGIVLTAEVQGWIGFAKTDKPEKAEFWFGEGEDENEIPHTPMHIAFAAETRAQVDEFHAAAMATGATCNGKPGIREMYHPNYYGAFVLDPDGHNIEAVCHTSE